MNLSPVADSGQRNTPCAARVLLCGAAVALLLSTGCGDPKVMDYRVDKKHDVAPAAEPMEAEASPHGVMPPAAGMPAAPVGPSGMAAIPVETASGAGLAWTAPADWQPKDLGSMRKGSFSVPGGAGAVADLSITAFPGAVGGELANVNRWRGQLALDPIEAAELSGSTTRMSAGELTFTVVDLVGTGDQPQRILGAMTPFGGAMWFFKLSGPDAVVVAAKPAFEAFLQTVKPANSATP